MAEAQNNGDKEENDRKPVRLKPKIKKNISSFKVRS